jgi:hypothetical protein
MEHLNEDRRSELVMTIFVLGTYEVEYSLFDSMLSWMLMVIGRT